MRAELTRGLPSAKFRIYLIFACSEFERLPFLEHAFALSRAGIATPAHVLLAGAVSGRRRARPRSRKRCSSGARWF